MATWGDGRIDLILRGTDNPVKSLRHKWWDGKEWKPSKTGWKTVQLTNLYTMEEPVVTTWRNSLFVIFNDVNSNIYLVAYDRRADKWGAAAEQVSSGQYRGKPSAISSGSWVKVVAVGMDGHMYESTYNGQSWSPPQNLGGSFSDAPKLVSWGPYRVDAFAKGINGILYRNTWRDSIGWEGWSDMGLSKLIISPPNAVSWGKDRIDVFVFGEGGVLCRNSYDGTQWGRNWYIGPADRKYLGVPEVVSWGLERIDLFLIDIRHWVNHIWYDDQGWHEAPYYMHPDFRLALRHIGRQVTAVSSAPERIDVFAVELDGTVTYQHCSKAMGWQPSRSILERLEGGSLFGVASSS